MSDRVYEIINLVYGYRSHLTFIIAKYYWSGYNPFFSFLEQIIKKAEISNEDYILILKRLLEIYSCSSKLKTWSKLKKELNIDDFYRLFPNIESFKKLLLLKNILE